MAHTPTQAAPIAASAAGALAGFEVRCEACGFVATNTIRFNVEQDGRDHQAYMARKAAGTRRRA